MNADGLANGRRSRKNNSKNYFESLKSSDRRHAQVREVLHFSSLVGHHNRGNRENFDGALGIDVEPNLSAADREALVADAPNAGWLLLCKEPAERRRENRRIEFHKLRVGSNRKLLALLRNQQREEIIPATSCLSPFATATFSFDRNELTASTIPEGSSRRFHGPHATLLAP